MPDPTTIKGSFVLKEKFPAPLFSAILKADAIIAAKY